MPKYRVDAGRIDTGAVVYLSQSDDPKRKLRHTWEFVEIDGTFVGVNTQNPNRIVGEALRAGDIPQLAKYDTLKAEVKYGTENSRIDYLLTNERGQQCYVEVKNVHYAKVEQGVRLQSSQTLKRRAV